VHELVWIKFYKTLIFITNTLKYQESQFSHWLPHKNLPVLLALRSEQNSNFLVPSNQHVFNYLVTKPSRERSFLLYCASPLPRPQPLTWTTLFVLQPEIITSRGRRDCRKSYYRAAMASTEQGFDKLLYVCFRIYAVISTSNFSEMLSFGNSVGVTG